MRNAFRYFLWVVLLLVGSAEALIVAGYILVLVTQGPRGVVGQFAHIAFSGRQWPVTPEESSRIFWTSTGEILAAELCGLLIVFGAWKLLRRFPPQRNEHERPSAVRT
jgi:hypothetical protein